MADYAWLIRPTDRDPSLHRQISFHQRQVAARASRPSAPVTATALCDGLSFARQPSKRKAVGPVPT